MKKIVMLFSLVVMWYGCGSQQDSQSVGSNAHGILTAAWGDTRDSVKAHLGTQGLVLTEDSADLAFTGGTYEGFPVDRWVLSFSPEGELISGLIRFTPDTTKSVSQVMLLEAALTARYGEPASPLEWRVGRGPSARVTLYRLAMAGGSTVELHVSVNPDMTDTGGTMSETPTVQ